jgi:hypothetical protein
MGQGGGLGEVELEGIGDATILGKNQERVRHQK